MRKQRAIALVEMDELDADIQAQCVYLAARWVYFHPPKIVFVPSKPPPFLPDNSNILAKNPNRRP